MEQGQRAGVPLDTQDEKLRAYISPSGNPGSTQSTHSIRRAKTDTSGDTGQQLKTRRVCRTVRQRKKARLGWGDAEAIAKRMWVLGRRQRSNHLTSGAAGGHFYWL